MHHEAVQALLSSSPDEYQQSQINFFLYQKPPFVLYLVMLITEFRKVKKQAGR
jgi:hypothetical protein